MLVSVRDTGVGIAPEHHLTIFEEFRQASSAPASTEREGTGLGLALAKRFVESQGGKIWVESAPGMGSTFTFTVPCREAAGCDGDAWLPAAGSLPGESQAAAEEKSYVL
jgi:signal transduction histidine kinase